MATALDVATRAASFNVLLQILLRISSFALNGFVLRFVQAELLGVVNLRLTLLYNTILFLAREPFRKAALTKTTATRQWQYTFNLMWLPLPVGVVCSIFISLLWVSPLLQQPSNSSGYLVGVACFSVSALVELCAEPLWVLGQLTQHVSIKVMAEGVPQVFKCLIVATGVVLYPQYGVLVFSMGQVVYSVFYLLMYIVYFARISSQNKYSNFPLNDGGILKILPRSLDNRLQNPYLIQLSKSFFKQSLLKQFLTDGERYIMTLLGLLTFAEQGVYDVINNLGSLVARFIFLPIEESFYVYFSSTLIRGEPPQKQSKESIQSSATVLSHLLKMVSLLALIIVAFGYNYSDLALDIYGGKILSQGTGPLLLKCYCVYVLFLAVNGITECFMFAALSQTQVERYNKNMLLFSLIFLSAAVVLIHLCGSVGFILANCVNMATRIVHSSSFIRNYFSTLSLHPLSLAMPSLLVIVSLALSWILTALSMTTFCCHFGPTYRLVHITNGCGCLLMVGMVIILAERELLNFVISRLPNKIQRLINVLIRRHNKIE